MSEATGHTVTILLDAVKRGEPGADEKLWSALYHELRAMAARQLARENNGNTLHPTSLVHDAYIRLLGEAPDGWENRRHFFFAAARAMRQIRIEAARHRARLKRGGGQRPVPLDENVPIFDEDPAEVLAIDEALTRLEKVDKRAEEVVIYRFFIGLTIEETARVMEVSSRTVQLAWRFARTWLHRELTRDGVNGSNLMEKWGGRNDRGSTATDSATL